MPGNLRAFTAELIGTFGLVFMAAGAVCMDAVTGGRLGLSGVALAYGLAFMTLSFALAPISGGHFNPAVTLGYLLAQRIGAVRAVGYALCQLLGAALAALLLRDLLHNYDIVNNAPFLGSCDLGGIGPKGATAVEAVLTFLLTLVIFGTSVSEGGKTPLAPVAVGSMLSLAVLVAGPLTGAAANPARAFGPAIASGHWAHHFVYWIGPLVGASAAALLFENFLMPPKP